jgi:hypothetical protein
LTQATKQASGVLIGPTRATYNSLLSQTEVLAGEYGRPSSLLLRIALAKAGFRNAFKGPAERWLELQNARDSRLAKFDCLAGYADDYEEFEVKSCSIYELVTANTDEAPTYEKFQLAQEDAALWFELRLGRDSRLNDYESTLEDSGDEFQEFQDLTYWISELASDKANAIFRAHTRKVRGCLPADCQHHESEPEESGSVSVSAHTPEPEESRHNKRTRTSTWGPPPAETPACSAAQ